MLRFIVGAARTGKGILARRLLVERRMLYLSLDVLKMGLTRGVPEYAINPDAGPFSVGERLWPLVREMSFNFLAEGADYVMEGELLPRHVGFKPNRANCSELGAFLVMCAFIISGWWSMATKGDQRRAILQLGN